MKLLGTSLCHASFVQLLILKNGCFLVCMARRMMEKDFSCGRSWLVSMVGEVFHGVLVGI
jgi:hypothetical protein